MIYTITLNPALDIELTVPEMAFDAVLRTTAERIDCGGKGFNVSRVLNALGTRSTALGFVGGYTGIKLKQGLEGLGIKTDFVQTVGETRTNISVINEEHSHYLKVNETGPSVTPEELETLLKKVRDHVKARDWWVMAGSIPPGVPDDFYAQIIKIVEDAGARTLIDTTGEALKLACEAGVFLAKPNKYEAETLLGCKINSTEDAMHAANKIHQMGAQVAVISLGKEGAIASDKTGAWMAHSPSISERNPIGAGDALVAGLVWGYGRRNAVETSLAWGVACGAAAAAQDGTGVGERDMVSELVKKVKVEKVG
jgi:1-phosphofructokinase family hexose kinase